MRYIANATRPKGAPKLVKSGRSSLAPVDRLARVLGWFSIGLGIAQLTAPHRMTRALGMDGMEPLMRAFGAREIGSGILTLSLDKSVGLWGRVAGDLLDVATLMPALDPANPKRGNVKVALAMVAAVTALDVVAAGGVAARHSRNRGRHRQFGDRSGFPKGVDAARGAARDFKMKSGKPNGPEPARATTLSS